MRILVLGPSSDVAAVRLYQAALAGTPPSPDARGDVLRLSRALDTLQACLDAKLDETQAFEDAAAARAASPLMDGAQLTEAEKLKLGQSLTTGLMVGVQSSIWSSFLLLVGGMALLALLNKPPA